MHRRRRPGVCILLFPDFPRLIIIISFSNHLTHSLTHSPTHPPTHPPTLIRDTTPRMILNHLRWLDHVVDASRMAAKLMEILGLVSVKVQKEMIVALPEMITDAQNQVRFVGWEAWGEWCGVFGVAWCGVVWCATKDP